MPDRSPSRPCCANAPDRSQAGPPPQKLDRRGQPAMLQSCSVAPVSYSRLTRPSPFISGQKVTSQLAVISVHQSALPDQWDGRCATATSLHLAAKSSPTGPLAEPDVYLSGCGRQQRDRRPVTSCERCEPTRCPRTLYWTCPTGSLQAWSKRGPL